MPDLHEVIRKLITPSVTEGGMTRPKDEGAWEIIHQMAYYPAFQSAIRSALSQIDFNRIINAMNAEFSDNEDYTPIKKGPSAEAIANEVIDALEDAANY